MDFPASSENVWLPNWTPGKLGKRFFFLGPDGLPKLDNFTAVESLEAADFVVVDDNILLNNEGQDKYEDISEKAMERKIPILSVSNVQFADQFIQHQPPLSPVIKPAITVQEYQDDEGYFTLIFDKNEIGTEDTNADELGYIILLRDPIVRSFIDIDSQSEEWTNLLLMLDWNPLRIKQTRWRIDDVWNSYISEAWNFIDEKTCVYDWSEEDKENFNEEYGTESDAIKPTDAVRAALFVFFIENKEAVLEISKSTKLRTLTEAEAEAEGNEYVSDHDDAPADSLDFMDFPEEVELENEAVKRANEPPKMKSEQGADNPHWSIHQYSVAGQATVESSTIINEVPDEEWFDNYLKEGRIKNIPYEDIKDKDVANPLGRGDTATVYRAKWDNTEVALKQFFETRIFFHEIRIVHEIGSHPNIIVVYGVTRNSLTGEFEIVTELAGNGVLDEYFKTRPNLRWPFKINMALDMARGLQHVYNKGFIHGNLNCSSFLIRKDYSIALCGFNMRNTMPYFFSNNGRSSGNSIVVNVDIFSFGVLLWEISALRPAFENIVDPEEWREILKDGRREIAEPGTPIQYQNLYDQCWNTDSSKWPNMETIVENLIQLAQSFDDSDRKWDDSTTLVADSVISESKVDVFEIFDELRKVYSHVISTDELAIEKYRYKWGGYADIHLGIWRGKKVAIKNQVKALSNIIREVEILKLAVPHSNIVKLEGIAQEKDTHHPYIVMELAKCSLHEYIHGKLYVIGRPRRVYLCVGIADGLAHLHGLDILHCDLHSFNVLISVNDQPLISDFGLSRTLAQARETVITKEYGRVAYTATERLKSKHPPPFEPPQDVFSLGVIIWEILSGERPSEGYGRINPNRGGPIQDYPAALIALYQQCSSDTPSNRPVASTVARELQKIEVPCDPIRIFMDENVMDLGRILRTIPNIDVDDVACAGLRGESDSVYLQWARRDERILVTTDTDYLVIYNENKSPILILWGRLGDRRFVRLKKSARMTSVKALFDRHRGEIEWVAKNNVCAMAIISGTLDDFVWVIRPPTEEEISVSYTKLIIKEQALPYAEGL